MATSQPEPAIYPYIPLSAFLHFPPPRSPHPLEPTLTARHLYDCTPNTAEQEAALLSLDQTMQKRQIVMGDFNCGSRLRYLLSNDSDVEKSMAAMKEYQEWKVNRSMDTSIIEHLLKKGAMYFSGRDEHYRPILIVNTVKLAPQDQEVAVMALDYLINYMVDVLLIEGQIENYVLIVNLAAYTVDLRSLLLRLLAFTSHCHPGRLYMCYMLNTPAVLSWNWHPITRKIVTQQTLSRISITGEKSFDGIWDHISKQMMEKSYGGYLGNINDNFWPPRQLLMQKEPSIKQHQISAQEYVEMYRQGKLAGRKVKKSLVGLKEEMVDVFTPPPAIHPILDLSSVQSELQLDLQKSESEREVAAPLLQNPINLASNKLSSFPPNEERQNLKNFTIKGEKSFIKDYRSLKTFFLCDPFHMVVGDKPRPEIDE